MEDQSSGYSSAESERGEGPDREHRRREFEARVAELENERVTAEEEGDQSAEGNALRKLGDLQRAMDLAEGARESYSRARYLFQLAGNGDGAATVLSSLGSLEMRQKRYDAAVRCFHQAAELYKSLGMPTQEADAHLSEGDACLMRGDSRAALRNYDDAAKQFAKADDTLGQAHSAFRLGTLALTEDPAEAEQQLELAGRLYADHVVRDSPQQDQPLPTRVVDSRRYPPAVMQRVCLRERQRLGFTGAAAKSSGAAQRRSRYVAPEVASEGTSWTVWIGLAVLVAGGLYLLLSAAGEGDGSAASWLLEQINQTIPLATVLHIAVGIFGAVTGVVAARQLGIGAPVVLLAMGIGFGAIFHEISRAVFVDIVPKPAAEETVTEESTLDQEAAIMARAAASKLIREAQAALQRGEVDGARHRLEKAAELAEHNVDRTGHARALQELLALETKHGSLQVRFEVAESLFESLSGTGKPGEREAIETLVALARREGNPAKLRDTHMKLLGFHERVGDAQGEVAALLSLAAIDRDAGDLDQAYEWYRRAHAIYQSLRDEQGQIGTLLAMGELDARLGRRRRAYGRYYHAFAMYREMGDRGGQAAMLLHMGSLDEAAERYEEASAAFRQSKKLYREVDDGNGEAQASLRFAATQAAHGNQRQARDAFRRALELFTQLDNTMGAARVHLGMGHLARKAGNNAQAWDHYEQALALYAEIGDRRGQLAALREIGLMARDQGAPAHKLTETVDRIDLVANQPTDPSARGELLLSAGDIVAALDRTDSAAGIYRRALEIFEMLGDDAGRRAARERLELITAAG